MIKIKTQYKEAIKYIKESKVYIIFVICAMVFGAIIGAIFSNSISTVIEPFIKELVSSIEGLNWGSLILFILQNNLKVAFFAIILGFAFGIFPFLNSIVNGVVLGYVFKITVEEAGFFELWRILPHGIFELPAIVISLAVGIKLGMFIFNKGKKERFADRFYNSMNVMLMIVIPLLIIAAIIEGSLIFFLK